MLKNHNNPVKDAISIIISAQPSFIMLTTKSDDIKHTIALINPKITNPLGIVFEYFPAILNPKIRIDHAIISAVNNTRER